MAIENFFSLLARFELDLGEGQLRGAEKLEFRHEYSCSCWREMIIGSSVIGGTAIPIDLAYPVFKFVRYERSSIRSDTDNFVE